MAYATASWREVHDGLSSFVFIECQDRSEGGEGSGGAPVHEVCFYSFAGAMGRGYLTYALTEDGRVADLYPEEFVRHPAQERETGDEQEIVQESDDP